MNTIDKKHPDYDSLRRRWRVGDLLMGGTNSMRESASTTLPMEQRESDVNYQRRVNASVLFNAYRKTVEALSLKPFAEPITYSKPVPTQWSFVEDDITEKCRHMVEHELRYGKTITVVGMPEIPEGMSELERQRLKLNPYWNLLHPDSFISWFYDDGELVRVKLEYEIEVLVSDEPEKKRRIDIIDTESTKTYEESDEAETGGWILVDEVPNIIGRVSIIIGGSVYDAPALENLAEMNLQHFRKSSDKDNILHMACCPFLMFAGWDEDDIKATVSVNNAYVSNNPNAKLDWIEVSGQGIELAISDLERLETKLMVAGADVLTEQQTKTATEKVIDNDDKMSTLQSIVVKVEKTLTDIFGLMAEWMGIDAPDFTVHIFKDFNITQQVKDEVDLLTKARVNRDISQETFLKELKRRKLFDNDFDIELELRRIEDSGEL